MPEVTCFQFMLVLLLTPGTDFLIPSCFLGVTRACIYALLGIKTSAIHQLKVVQFGKQEATTTGLSSFKLNEKSTPTSQLQAVKFSLLCSWRLVWPPRLQVLSAENRVLSGPSGLLVMAFLQHEACGGECPRAWEGRFPWLLLHRKAWSACLNKPSFCSSVHWR